VSSALWLAGAALPGDRRLLVWIPAVVLDLCAPVAGYGRPRRELRLAEILVPPR
jgi:low temperature requirement protein LtrA